MIRINLLTAKKSKALVTLWKDASILGGTILILLIGVLYINHDMNNKLTRLRLQVNNTKRQIETSKMDLKKIEELKKDKYILENKITIIDSLREKQSWPVHVLDELGMAIPDHIWLTNFSNRADIVKLEGISPSYNAVSDFMKRLNDSRYFKSIELENIQLDIVKGKNFHRFRISCFIEMLPQPAES